MGAAGVGLAVVLLLTACASTGRPAPDSVDSSVDSSAAREETASSGGFEMAVGVVVAPSVPAIYLARPGGGIEAIDARSGELLWSSEEAARPLAVHAGRLLAQRESGGGLPLSLLDAAKGRLLRRLDIPLPAGVRAVLDESPAGHFRISSRIVGRQALLEWEYLEHHAQGVSPPEDRPFARRERGLLRVDLESGEATALEAEEATAEVRPLPTPVQGLVDDGTLRAPPWRVGAILAAARQQHESGGARLVLWRWRSDSGDELPEVTLEEGRPVAVLAAADSRHLLAVSTPGAEPGASGGYLWRIYSLATGELVAGHRAERSAAPFCLLRGQLLHIAPPSGWRVGSGWEESPRRLCAVDPESGVELWQRPIRDPVWRGPAPPATISGRPPSTGS